MTPAVWVAIAAPLLALAGVVVGLWLGQKRWRSEQQQKERETYDKNHKSTYLELWEVVEDIHIKMREALEGLSPEEFGGMIADVNNFMIRKGLFIERRDRFLVLEYLFWTNEFLRRIVSSAEGRGFIAISLAGDEIRVVAEMENIEQMAEELRGRLRARIREVLGAPSSTAWSPDEKPSDELILKMRKLSTELSNKRHELSPPNSSQLETSPRPIADTVGEDDIM